MNKRQINFLIILGLNMLEAGFIIIILGFLMIPLLKVFNVKYLNFILNVIDGLICFGLGLINYYVWRNTFKILRGDTKKIDRDYY